jgi:hypothetical protein
VSGAEGSKGSIGRGQTFSVVHISELPTWENPEQLDTALLPAIPYAADTLVLYEATAEFAGDWWHKHWLASGQGEGRFSNIFIPWCAEPLKYSLPAPVDWTPSISTTTHAENASGQPRGSPAARSRFPATSYRMSGPGVLQAKGQLYKFRRIPGRRPGVLTRAARSSRSNSSKRSTGRQPQSCSTLRAVEPAVEIAAPGATRRSPRRTSRPRGSSRRWPPTSRRRVRPSRT